MRSVLRGEDGLRIQPNLFNVDGTVRGERLPYSKCGIPHGKATTTIGGYAAEPSEETYGRWNGGWLRIAELYSQRNFTAERDKLIALAGLARVIARITGANTLRNMGCAYH